jgi:hypothetical protein
VSKTAYIAEGAYAFEMTNTHGGGICCQYGAVEFKMTVNGEQRATSCRGELRDVVCESFDGGSDAVLAPPSPIGRMMSRTMSTRMRRVGRYTVS